MGHGIFTGTTGFHIPTSLANRGDHDIYSDTVVTSILSRINTGEELSQLAQICHSLYVITLENYFYLGNRRVEWSVCVKGAKRRYPLEWHFIAAGSFIVTNIHIGTPLQ